jgi:hypothetical protein
MTSEGKESNQTERSSPLTAWAVAGAGVLALVVLFSDFGSMGAMHPRGYPSRALAPEPAPMLLPSPEVDEEYFPCSDCHFDETTHRNVRELQDDHDDIELKHGDLWCLHCHDADDKDQLHLADEGRVAFDESWRLCTQCHANKLADWRAGVHGKRTGSWWGPKEYQTCVVCHAPHSPRFGALEPKPPPKRPSEIRLHVRAEEEARDEGH